jgi:hypothetical protein
MPPASWPTACIFWDCANCTSSLRRSVMSMKWAIQPEPWPEASSRRET